MIIDGKLLAEQIKNTLFDSVKVLPRAPHLAIVLVGNNPMSVKYTNLKKQIGESLGFRVTIEKLDQGADLAGVVDLVKKLSADPIVDGVIVQLPLPAGVLREVVFQVLAPAKDVDALTVSPFVLSPVVRAIEYILTQNNIDDLSNLKAVVIGHGYLVGQPIAKWLNGRVAALTILTKETSEDESRRALAEADLVVSGAGVPGLVKPDEIKTGAILIDASTSDVGGKTVGDIDPACAAKAKLFTPVPGGVGPLTVVMLFANLLELMKK